MQPSAQILVKFNHKLSLISRTNSSTARCSKNYQRPHIIYQIEQEIAKVNSDIETVTKEKETIGVNADKVDLTVRRGNREITGKKTLL
jgi:hypothetical protein